MAIGVDVRIVGANQLEDVARAIRAYADAPALRKEMLKGLRSAAKPAAAAIQDAYRDGLPHGGGLNEFVASTRFAPRTRTSGRSAGVRITGKKSGHDLEAIEHGDIRHQTYGHSPWVSQSVEQGLGEKALREKAPRVQADLKDVLNDIASRIARSV